ncbi:acyl carrier protein [Tropicimonas sp. IMCC6043]|uniref:acyl carrier protein n=1 Tax=Tropicimonas sp. IMCC6043 TaxID=2510645 RepID=UPI00101BAFC8|nr:phosphopantetheine-binding protein [Tropicimonas sp. IMCC6043]RYH11702.1 acyl carrier protein [Tropicimonas sp. IMCC6043]
MTEQDFRAAFVEELIKIAPDLEPDEIGDNDHIQDDLDLDSMDVLNLVAALHARFGLNIPEADYVRIATPALASAYLAAELAA